MKGADISVKGVNSKVLGRSPGMGAADVPMELEKLSAVQLANAAI